MVTTKMAGLAITILFCLSNTALAQRDAAEQSRSVRSLYKDCQGRDISFCDGYLSGVVNALNWQRHYNLKWNEEYCPPKSATPSSQREIFLSWAERTESWTRNCYDGVLLAFWVNYFCRQQ